MASNSGLNLETLTRSNVTSFVQCVLELVAASLTAHATAIAIRIHTKKREIQVIDNGIGIQKDALDRIGEYNAKTASNQQRTYDLFESNNRMLISIRCLSDTFTIASRYRDSMETFMKIYKVDCAPDLKQVEQRPSQGTTVSIYGFHEIPMRRNSDVNTICCFITALAVAKLEVSFSVRDEKQMRVALRIAKPHSPIDVLRTLFGRNLSLNHIWLIHCSVKYNTNYYGYIGLSDKTAMQCIFLNHRLISCSFILKLIITGFKENLNSSFHEKFNTQDIQDKNIFILLFLTLEQDEFMFVTENGKKLLIFHDMQKILNSIKVCAFKCIAEEVTISAGTTYFYDTQLLKQICVTSETSVFNDISGRIKNITPLKSKVVVTSIKKRITSNVLNTYSNKQWNKSDDIKVTSHRSNQLDIDCAKYKKSCEDQISKKLYRDVDKTQTHCRNLAVTNDFADQKDDDHKSKNDDVSNISLCSEWSDWTHCSNNKERNSVRNVQETFYSNKQWNKSDDIKITSHRSNQLDIDYAKYKKSGEDQISKKVHSDVDKIQTHCSDLAVTNVFADRKDDDHDNKNDDFANISLCSEWSDWTHCSNNKECNSVRNVQETFSTCDARYQRLLEYTRQFDFVPEKLHGLLQYRQDKMTNVNYFNGSNSAISLSIVQGNRQHEKAEVHPCNLKERLCELRLSHASLKCIKVINQINDEFIAAWMMYDQMKILLMIDQHAVHERIRYEDLLFRYKAQNEDGLLSVNLRNPLAVEFPTQTCNLLLCHKMLLRKYGISLGSLKKNTLLIRAIPQCLVTNNDQCNSEKLLPRIYSLLNDILENRNTANRILPLTIHDAIASEACHGAIKFGDKLTFEQCTRLVKLLGCTKSPNRCAHGRPTVVPVMDLSELERRSTRIREKKLNFASLKRLDLK